MSMTSARCAFLFPKRGGRRPGAGRKSKGERAGVSHAARPAVAARLPVLVTMKVVRSMCSLRSKRAFNRIWRVRRPRSLMFRVLTYWSVLTLGPLLIGAGLSMTSYLVSTSLGYAHQIPGAATLVLALVPVVLTALAFTLLYWVVPNRRVLLWHAFVGGLLAAVMFEGMKRGFALYISSIPSYARVYGTFAAIPVSLNGLGLREGGYIFLLAVLGIGTEQSIAFGILLFMIVALDSLIGGLLFLFQRMPKPQAVAATDLDQVLAEDRRQAEE